jgi:hypothetical protein
VSRKPLAGTRSPSPEIDFDLGRNLSLPARADGSQWRQPPSPSDSVINAATVGWMKQLPPELAPVELAVQYPRILNRLARFWEIPGMIHEYFEDLLFAKRARRKGFAPNVKAEIIALCNYYRSLHPVDPAHSSDLWDEVRERAKNLATVDRKTVAK